MGWWASVQRSALELGWTITSQDQQEGHGHLETDPQFCLAVMCVDVCEFDNTEP